ncbi:UNVERIFIED_CONTAM: hypothetical protein Sindi_1299400 [Sesamum indicum]
MMQNGEVVVRPTLKAVRDGSMRWKSTAVGYFMGKRPYFHHLKYFAHSIWPSLREVTATANGFVFFQFKTTIDMEEVIEGGPWLFQGQQIILQKWEPGMAMRKLHLPMEFWTTEGLSTAASGVACTRMDFARVCVMIDVKQKLHIHIIVMAHNEDFARVCRRQDGIFSRHRETRLFFFSIACSSITRFSSMAILLPPAIHCSVSLAVDQSLAVADRK